MPLFVEELTTSIVRAPSGTSEDENDARLRRPSGLSVPETLHDALIELQISAPDCVLLDLGLPDSDGFSAVPQMVAAVPDIAIIVLTGRQERDGLDALAAGAQDYIVKDTLTGELLQRSIRYAIERKRAQRAQQQLREIRLSAA